MHLEDIPLLKRNASGNKAMNTDEELEGLSVIYPDMECIVVVTANASSGDKEEYITKGFDDYLSKPINLKDLDKIIKKFFTKKVIIKNNK